MSKEPWRALISSGFFFVTKQQPSRPGPLRRKGFPELSRPVKNCYPRRKQESTVADNTLAGSSAVCLEPCTHRSAIGPLLTVVNVLRQPRLKPLSQPLI